MIEQESTPWTAFCLMITDLATSVSPFGRPPETEMQRRERLFRSRLTGEEQDFLDDLLISIKGIKRELEVDFLVLLVGGFARSLDHPEIRPHDIDLRIVNSATPCSDGQKMVVEMLEQKITTLLEEQRTPLERRHCFDGSIDLYFRTQKQPNLRPFDITVNSFKGPDIEGHLADERKTRKPYFVLLDTRDGQDK